MTKIKLALYALIPALVVLVSRDACSQGRLPQIGDDFQPSRSPVRHSTLLSGNWKLRAVQRDNPVAHNPAHPHYPLFAMPEPLTSQTVTVQVPGVWQNQGLGMNYHGTAIYQKSFQRPKTETGHHTWLHFERVATMTTVTLNGEFVGFHQGAWTPFEFDITDALKKDAPNKLEVEVAEAGEHYTSGFIKSISNSFGGIWGDVWIEERAPTYIEDSFAWLDTKTSEVVVWTAIDGEAPDDSLVIQIIDKDGNTVAHQSAKPSAKPDAGKHIESRLKIKDLALWSSASPILYTIITKLVSPNNTVSDDFHYRTGFRTTTMDADHLYIDGKPVYWASILHWACHPEYLAPFLSESEFRSEIKKLKECGYNGVNVCLFMFPRRYYEIADEEGMMLWQEYPLWFYYVGVERPSTPPARKALVREFDEMFTFDRTHPSIVMRSMACEDPAPDLKMMKHLYDMCHDMIPGSLAQDNTAFLDQHFADFYDMHPYVENEDFARDMKEWTAKSRRLGNKPFLFGEGLDNDTFRDFDAIEAAGPDKPWWTHEKYCRSLVAPASSGNYWGQLKIVHDLKMQFGPDILSRLIKSSYAHAMTSRKFQIEQSRIYKFFAGLSMTAIRDVICTRPGIFDELDQLKWTPAELRDLNAQTMIIFDFERKSQTYYPDEKVTGTVYLSHYDPEELKQAKLQIELVDNEGRSIARQNLQITTKPGFTGKVGSISFSLPATTSPRQLKLTAKMKFGSRSWENQWKVWGFPRAEPSNNVWALGLPDVDASGETASPIRVVDSLTSIVLKYVEDGGRVLVMQKGPSPEVHIHRTPFWRETTLLHSDESLFQGFPWEEFIDMQFYGLSRGIAMDVAKPGSVDAPRFNTLFRTINCRSLQQNDYIAEMNRGAGRLIITTFDLDYRQNPAGRWIFDRLIERLKTGNEATRK